VAFYPRRTKGPGMASNGSLRPEQEQYVRVRAGRDGGTFVVPAAPLCELSATVAGMLRPGANFVEEQALISVPGATAASSDLEGSSAVNPCATRSADAASRDAGAREGAAGVEGGEGRRGVIAVDGPAASGKGTLARALAKGAHPPSWAKCGHRLANPQIYERFHPNTQTMWDWWISDKLFAQVPEDWQAANPQK
jgi:hypothetical protein